MTMAGGALPLGVALQDGFADNLLRERLRVGMGWLESTRFSTSHSFSLHPFSALYLMARHFNGEAFQWLRLAVCLPGIPIARSLLDCQPTFIISEKTRSVFSPSSSRSLFHEAPPLSLSDPLPDSIQPPQALPRGHLAPLNHPLPRRIIPDRRSASLHLRKTRHHGADERVACTGGGDDIRGGEGRGGVVGQSEGRPGGRVNEAGRRGGGCGRGGGGRRGRENAESENTLGAELDNLGEEEWREGDKGLDDCRWLCQ